MENYDNEDLLILEEAIQRAANQGKVPLTKDLCSKLDPVIKSVIRKARLQREEAITLNINSMTDEETEAAEEIYHKADWNLISAIEHLRQIPGYISDLMRVAEINSKGNGYREAA
jgi:hypothetical protein